VDLHLPGIDVLAYIRQIKQFNPDCIIIAFTQYDFPEYHTTVYQSGADHFIPKDTWTGEEMLKLVESIVSTKDRGKEG
jgi:DNA-binding NarL/FixJ family response regulator